MSLFATANFNTAIYRVNPDGCPGLVIPYIGLKFYNCTAYNEKGYIGGNGDFASDSIIIDIFDSYVDSRWSYKTLAQIGTNTSKANTAIAYVEFVPSIENISIYLYNLLQPIYMANNVSLVTTLVRDAMFLVEYSP